MEEEEKIGEIIVVSSRPNLRLRARNEVFAEVQPPKKKARKIKKECK